MRQALSLLVFCVLASPLFAGTTLPTPSKPVTIIRQNEVVHVFTSAIDLNYDTKQDAGDRPATWQTIDISTLTTQRVLEFPWTPGNTSRPWLSADADMMFVAVGDSVIAYTASTQVFAASFPLPGSPNIHGVYFDETLQALLVSTRPDAINEPGQVLSMSQTGNVIAPVGVNPQQIVGYNSTVNGRGFAVVCEGAFGQGDGSVVLFGGVKTTIPVGDTPNHIITSGDTAYVTVNGSHFVVVIDLNTQTAVDTILVGTAGFDGPREAAILDGRLFVTTYAGDVRIFDIVTGARVGFILHGPRPEGLSIVGSTVWVTRSMGTNYEADSGIVLYELDSATSTPWDVIASATVARNGLAVAPSVAADNVTVDTPDGPKSIRFVDAAGRVYTLPVLSENGSTATYDVTSLSSGGYTCIDGTKSGRFIVKR